MAAEFIQRQIDRLLGQAAEALDRSDWDTVRQRAEDVLRLDPDNADARSLEEAARRSPRGWGPRAPRKSYGLRSGFAYASDYPHEVDALKAQE